MMVCRIKKVKNPETKVVPTMIKILISKICLMSVVFSFPDCRYCSTEERELPISLGANNEKILAMIVIKNPQNNLVRYFKKYLFK